MAKDKPLLKISISGPDVKPGRIAIPILLKLCQEAQAAVNRQAEVIEAKRTDKPSAGLISRECALELIGLKRGSTTLEFAPANKQLSLIPEMASFGLDAVSAVATVLQNVNRKSGKWKTPDPRLLDALDDLGTVFEAGVDKVKWIVPRQSGHKGTTGEFVPATLRKVRRRKQESLSLEQARITPPAGAPPALVFGSVPQLAAPIQESFLEGMLDVAEGKIRITPSLGSPTTMSYGPDKAESILEALHKPVRVKFDPKTRKVVDIEVTAADTMDGTLFFTTKSIDELIEEQGVQAVADLSVLTGDIPDEDIDEFVAGIY
jgi:hypothetical protein